MVIIVMGVTGCGKTTVGQLLADKLQWVFLDADDFHPEANVAKMQRGEPLTDQDRLPWLQGLNQILLDRECGRHVVAAQGIVHQGKVPQVTVPQGTVLACSALKRQYRQHLTAGLTLFRFAYLDGEFELIRNRLHARVGHYMNPVLLESQFATLEAPTKEERALRIPIGSNPETIVNEIAEVMGFSLLELGPES